MIFAHIRDESAKAQLVEAIKATDKPHVYRRLMVVQLSSEGKTVPQLASIFKLTPQTIRKSIHAYNAGGIESAMPQPKPGRRRQITVTKERWLEILHTPPLEFDRLKTDSYNWTLNLLTEYLKAYHGVSMTRSNVWYILRKHKLNMGRSQLKITSPDPQYTTKRRRVDRLKKKRKSGN
jgi:transposase